MVRLLSSPPIHVLFGWETMSRNSPCHPFPSGAQVIIVRANFQNLECMRLATSSTLNRVVTMNGFLSAVLCMVVVDATPNNYPMFGQRA
jgi:hypothetical protein